MKITNEANLPDAIVRAVENDPYVGGGDISATTLIGPPQIAVLTKKHWDEITEDASDRIWSLIGQVVHGILERANETGVAEQRLYTDVDGWKLSGQFDRIALTPEMVLQDYKVTSAWSFLKPKPEWENQLNVLAYLAEANGYNIDKLEVVAIFRDWSRNQAKRSADYPKKMVARISVPLWEPAIAERYIRQRIALHKRAREGEHIPCTNEERWYKGDEFALMKQGRASALRVMPTEKELMTWATVNGHVLDGKLRSGLSIVYREGEYTRCQEYCAVSCYCPQLQTTE